MRERLLMLVTVCCLAGCQGDPSAYSVRVRALSDMRYELDIIRNSDRTLLQTIAIRNGVDPSESGHVELVDLDRDGHPDLRVLGGRTDQGPWHKIWRFDPRTHSFIWSHTTEADAHAVPGLVPSLLPRTPRDP